MACRRETAGPAVAAGSEEVERNVTKLVLL